MRSLKQILLIGMSKKPFYIIPDKLFLKMKYKLKTGNKLNLKDPKTFNEKLQWLKIHDRKDIYIDMVDKAKAKEYVSKIIGEEYIIPTIGIYESFDDIDFDKLPKQFVIKCTHDSGGLVIVKDKLKLDINNTRKIINKCLKRNYYYVGREWPYKNVKPRIIIEKYMEDKKFKSMQDYKFFCFNGNPKIMYISSGLENHDTAAMSFFDMNYKIIPLKRLDYKLLSTIPPKPKNFNKMKEFSETLSKGIPHIRVDWYEINGKLYFGELTFSTCAGMMPFENEKWNEELGNWIKLPKEK